jgi:hypothetical protein
MAPVELIAFRRYLDRLIGILASDPLVLGVVGLGSTALLPGRLPDEWSDHDVWVVVADGAEEGFRTDPSWLPDSERLVLWMRETRHGMKGVYDDGHLVEMAVFRVDELAVTRANDYRVLLDRENISGRMEAVRAGSVASPDPGYLAGQFLTNLLVGAARCGRGERLSGHDFVKGQAVGHLLALANAVLDGASTGGAAADDLAPWRRAEWSHPGLAAEVDAALALDTPQAAVALLEVGERHVARRTPGWPQAAARVIDGALRRWAGRAAGRGDGRE